MGCDEMHGIGEGAVNVAEIGILQKARGERENPQVSGENTGGEMAVRLWNRNDDWRRRRTVPD